MRIGSREAVSVYLEPAQKAALDAVAKKRRVKLAQLMREVVDAYLKNPERKS